MECINATSLDRKSGQTGHPAFVAGQVGKKLQPLEKALVSHSSQSAA
jgi:hypothetical protein